MNTNIICVGWKINDNNIKKCIERFVDTYSGNNKNDMLKILNDEQGDFFCNMDDVVKRLSMRVKGFCLGRLNISSNVVSTIIGISNFKIFADMEEFQDLQERAHAIQHVANQKQEPKLFIIERI